MAIIKRDSNLPISFISKAYICSKAVGRIVVNNGMATGFLISGSLVVTCNHVIPDIDTAINSSFQIDYYVKADGSFNQYTEFKLDPATFFSTSKELNITVVAIKSEVDLSDRCLPIVTHTGSVSGESINLIHHINGEPQKISFRDGTILELSELQLRYDAPTKGGSSGAPIFNDQWELIGMHQQGGYITSLIDPSTKIFINGGVRTSVLITLFNITARNPSLTSLRPPTHDVNKSLSITTDLSTLAPQEIEEDKEDRDSIFISYAHKDQEKIKWQDKLELHLKTIPSIGARRVWQDDRIEAGSEWKREIELALAKTKVAVLLIGPNFLISDFILNNELPELLEAAKNEGVIIIPLITHRVAYNRSILGKYQSFNPPEKPLQEQSKNGNAEKTLVSLVEKIANLYE